jgi:hypothetical protein
MMRKGGFLTPQYFSSLSESRHYIMCLEKADVDALKSQYKFDLKKPNALHTLFEKYNILSLVVIDSVSKNIVFYDSDNPLRGTLYNYEKSVGQDEAMSIFANLLRH